MECAARCGRTFGRSAFLRSAGEPHDRHGRDILVRHAAEIVAERKAWRRRSLSRARAAEQLKVILVDHPDAGCADRMAEAFEAAVDLAGHLSVGVEEAVEHVLPALPRFGDMEVF